MRSLILKTAAAVAATAALTLGGAGAATARPDGADRKVNEYEGQHRKVNEYEGQHRVGADPSRPMVGDPSQWG